MQGQELKKKEKELGRERKVLCSYRPKKTECDLSPEGFGVHKQEMQLQVGRF
jgi:hypothetical protein